MRSLKTTATWAIVPLLALICTGIASWTAALADEAQLVRIEGVSPTSLRWWDVAANVYAADYRSSYDYLDATVMLTTTVGGDPATLLGHLSATNLKPNFAYQMKLEGKPTGIWGVDGDDLANERIGYLGRWWREQPSPGNATDADYEAHHDDPAYIYKGYLLFGYFVTDRDGGLEFDFTLDSSYHVLANDAQGAPGVCDGGFFWRTVIGEAGDPAYDADVGPTDVGVYAVREPGRPCAGDAALPVGFYNCRFLLTEESFHQTGDGAGGWASVLSHDHLHFDLASSAPGAHDYVDIGNPASEAGHALAGWGPTEPDFGGGDWGGIGGEDPPGRCRTIWSPHEQEPVAEHASLELDFGFSGTEPKCLRLRYLDGDGDDSFDVDIDGAVVLSVAAPSGPGTWQWTSVDVTGYTGLHTVRFTATAPAGGDFDPSGQTAVDKIGLGSLVIPVPTNDDPEIVRPLACGGTRQVDVHYLRDCNHEPVRGYSVRVRCPEGEDAISFDDADITVNTVPEGLDPAACVWQIYRAPDAAAANDWTVDYVILGDAAGATGGIPDQAVLFSVDVHGDVEGAGRLLIENAVVGPIDGGRPRAIGPGETTIAMDCTGPAAITGLIAAPGHDKVLVGWNAVSEPDGRLEIWRGMWYVTPPDTSVSAYPEYDDWQTPEDLEPAWPLAYGDLAAGDQWHHVRTVPSSQDSIVDFPNPPAGLRRGVYYYLVFAVDAAGNLGDPPSEYVRATSYLLGDLPSLDGALPADGAIAIYPEITRLGLCYGTADGDAYYDPYCDIGPTDDTSGYGIPLTDSSVGFEDLMIFAVNYDLTVQKSPPSGGAAAARFAWVRRGALAWSLHLLEPCRELKGLHLSADLPPGAVAAVAAGELLDRQAGPVFLQNIDPHGLDTGVAVLGRGAVIAGEGELLRIDLTAEHDLSLAVIEIRDADNRPCASVQAPRSTGPVIPSACTITANRPNPFNPSTTLDFTLPAAQRVLVAVHALDGRRVALLLDEVRSAGSHVVTWNGRDDEGREMPSGTYVCRLQAGEVLRTVKMTLLK